MTDTTLRTALADYSFTKPLKSGAQTIPGVTLQFEEIKPVKTFHDQRHTVFTPEQNVALDAAAPIVAMIKTKGRGR